MLIFSSRLRPPPPLPRLPMEERRARTCGEARPIAGRAVTVVAATGSGGGGGGGSEGVDGEESCEDASGGVACAGTGGGRGGGAGGRPQGRSLGGGGRGGGATRAGVRRAAASREGAEVEEEAEGRRTGVQFLGAFTTHFS